MPKSTLQQEEVRSFNGKEDGWMMGTTSLTWRPPRSLPRNRESSTGLASSQYCSAPNSLRPQGWRFFRSSALAAAARVVDAYIRALSRPTAGCHTAAFWFPVDLQGNTTFQACSSNMLNRRHMHM